MTKVKLLKEVRKRWESLQRVIGQLTEAQLSEVRSLDGWAVKDHLAHLAAWERSALAIILGEPRYKALGVSEAAYASGDTDQVNAAIYEYHREVPVRDTLAAWSLTHQDLLAALETLSEADLHRPDTEFLPGERGDPLIERIVGNTIEHYHEHYTWFSSLIAKA
jgi:hypothetical protein